MHIMHLMLPNENPSSLLSSVQEDFFLGDLKGIEKAQLFFCPPSLISLEEEASPTLRFPGDIAKTLY
jgi:hypothetical protein